MEIKDKAIFAGSFDPFTLGHLSIVKKALKDFREIIILIAVNENKKAHYPLKDRIKFIKLSIKDLKGIKVDSTKGLTVDYAKKHRAKYLIRGIRSNKDKKYEEELKKINLKLNPNIKTIIYKADKRYQNISSSLVNDMLKKGEDISPFVNKNIKRYL